MNRIDVSKQWLRGFDLTATLRLSVLLAIFHAPASVWTMPALRVISVSMILLPRLLLKRSWWWALAGVSIVGLLSTWESADNHKYLIVYWLVACAAVVAEPEQALARLSTSARLLIATVFILAACWKLAAGQYLNGTFWFVTLALDDRLRGLTALLTGHNVSELAALRDAVQQLGMQGFEGVPIETGELVTLRSAALLLSVLTLGVEIAVGAVHLSANRRVYLLRHTLLLGFMVTTYSLMPVLGFAAVLAVLGVAACYTEDIRLKAAYLIVLAMIHLIRLPSAAIISD